MIKHFVLQLTLELREKLYNDKFARLAMARNPATPAKYLKMLAEKKNIGTRIALAENFSTPSLVLFLLACDKEGEVREAVAANPNTPLRLVAKMRNDSDTFVQRAAKTSYRRRTK